MLSTTLIQIKIIININLISKSYKNPNIKYFPLINIEFSKINFYGFWYKKNIYMLNLILLFFFLENFFNDYKFHLIGIVIGMIILILLYFYAKKRHPKVMYSRIIFLISLMIINLYLLLYVIL